MTYLLHLAVMIGIYLALTASLNLAVGYGGMLTLSHGAFYGTGAYVAAILALRLDAPFLISALAATAVGAVMAGIVAAFVLRFEGEFFVLATLGMQALIHSLMYNLKGVTGGPFGLDGIPRPEFPGWAVSSVLDYALLCAALAAGMLWIVRRLALRPYGRALQSVREDAIAAESLGYSAPYYRATAFVLSGALAAAVGAFYASYVTYIDPSSFELTESVFILSALIVGGAASVWGPVIGATVLVLLPELLRLLPLAESAGPNIRQIALSLFLVLILLSRPQGIAGRYAVD